MLFRFNKYFLLLTFIFLQINIVQAKTAKSDEKLNVTKNSNKENKISKQRQLELSQKEINKELKEEREKKIITKSKKAKDKLEKEQKENKKKDNFFKSFAKKYIAPEENQIFGKNKYGIFFTYGASINEDRKGFNKQELAGYDEKIFDKNDSFIEYDPEKKKYYKYDWNGDYRYRAAGSAAIHYSVPDKFMYINGRLSVGLTSWHGLNSEYNKRFGALGVELIQELIFGSSMLYITAGVGPAYMLPFNHYNKHTNMASQFFFAIVANVGHRFNNGMVVEAGIKHYSNGELRTPNRGLNLVNFTIGYTF